MGNPEQRASLEDQAEVVRASIERADDNENPIERNTQLDSLLEALWLLEDELKAVNESQK